MLAHGILGALADIVDDGTGLFQCSGLDQGFRPHEHHVSVAEDIVIHRESLPGIVVGLTF